MQKGRWPVNQQVPPKNKQNQPSKTLVVPQKVKQWNKLSVSRPGSQCFSSGKQFRCTFRYSHHLKCLNFVSLKSHLSFFLVALPSLNVSCSLASWYVIAIAISCLQTTSSVRLTTSSSSTNQINSYLGSHCFQTPSWYFPSSTMLANTNGATQSPWHLPPVEDGNSSRRPAW